VISSYDVFPLQCITVETYDFQSIVAPYVVVTELNTPAEAAYRIYQECVAIFYPFRSRRCGYKFDLTQTGMDLRRQCSVSHLTNSWTIRMPLHSKRSEQQVKPLLSRK
jgi:hypothetical protein